MVKTTQEFSTSSFTLRLCAALIDFFLLIILMFLIKMAFPDFSYILFFEKAEPFITGNTQNWVLSKSSLVLVWIVYSIIMDSSTVKGTFGKQMMNIQVTDEDGNRISIKQSIARNLFKIVSYAIVGFGFLYILFDKKNQGWHDRFADTLVTDKPV